MTRLTREFFTRDAADLAAALIGVRLVRKLPGGQLLSGTIVETEAYLGVRDRASHAYRGRRTPRNEAMYAMAGTAYVYFTYGMHFCVNVVCASEGDPQAVLLRALEPGPDEKALQTMRRLRGVEADRLLCSGPGRLCQALAINRGQNGVDLCKSTELWLEAGSPRNSVRCTRIGIESAGVWAERRLRWLDPASEHVSRGAQGKRSVRRKAGRSKNRKGT